MSGRFKTLVRMQEEDVPDGRLLSSSLKSTIFHAHEGEWQVSSTTSSPFCPCGLCLLRRANKAEQKALCSLLNVLLNVLTIASEVSLKPL